MKSISELQASIPHLGKVEWIGLRTEQRGDVISVDRALSIEAVGLEGDHRSKRKPDPENGRHVTLIQAEHLPVIASILNRALIDPALLRRNIVVSGINLQSLKGFQFRIGDALFEGTGLCHPCSRMEETLGHGGYSATRGHGGLNAKVIEGGEICVGDSVALELKE